MKPNVSFNRASVINNLAISCVLAAQNLYVNLNQKIKNYIKRKLINFNRLIILISIFIYFSIKDCFDRVFYNKCRSCSYF